MERVHTLSICRICLVGNVRMHSVLDKKLQEVYEKLSSVPFETDDGRPSLACYMCYQRLRKCHQFAIKCMQTEAMFTRILTNSNKSKLINVEANSEPFKCLSVTPVLQVHINGSVDFVDVKEEPTDESEQHDDDELSPDDLLEIVEHKVEDFQIQSKEDDIALPVINTKEETDTANLQNDLYNEYKEHSIARLPNKLKKSKASNNVKPRDQVATTEKPYKCDVCDKRFKWNSYQIRHSRVHSGERPYKCNICQSTFKDKSNLNEHTLTHTDEKPYKCNICHKRFNNNSRLVRHSREHSGERPYKCDICHKGFNWNSDLIRHSRVHSGERPYNCDICHKRFPKNSDLIRHIRVHSDERPYKCDICQYRCKDKSNLNEHTRRHTGEKPYKCDVCHKRFNSNGNLITHGRVHSGERPYKCDICQCTFKDQAGITRHTLRHNGKKTL